MRSSASSPFVDGVMLGRAAYHDPYLLADVDTRLFGDARPARSRYEIIEALAAYARNNSREGRRCAPSRATCWVSTTACAAGRRFRQVLSDATRLHDADVSLLADAVREVG
jgi:tRNA-dihydrouridine synthase A